MDYDGKRCQYKEQVRGLQEQRENFSQSVDQKILDFFLIQIKARKYYLFEEAAIARYVVVGMTIGMYHRPNHPLYNKRVLQLATVLATQNC